MPRWAGLRGEAWAGGAPGGWGGAGPALLPPRCFSLSLWPPRSPPPLSPAASSRAQWETDDTAEYVSSVLPPATDELLLFPRAVLCCDPLPSVPPIPPPAGPLSKGLLL